MTLPKLDLPIFELNLVSIKDPVKFRPFLVKEEKLLLMALQSDDEESIFKTIKQVINNCLVSEVDIDKIPIFDIEYLFLNIRARSIGEDIETMFLCNNIIKEESETEKEESCGFLMPVKVNVLDIKPPVASNPSKIYITDKVGIQLAYPTLRSFKPVDDLIISNDTEKLFDLIYECLDYVFDESSVYYKKETSKEEFRSFMESLTQEQFDSITSFFELLPSISHEIDTKCQRCGFEHKLKMEGLNDFFI